MVSRHGKGGGQAEASALLANCALHCKQVCPATHLTGCFRLRETSFCTSSVIVAEKSMVWRRTGAILTTSRICSGVGGGVRATGGQAGRPGSWAEKQQHVCEQGSGRPASTHAPLEHHPADAPNSTKMQHPMANATPARIPHPLHKPHLQQPISLIQHQPAQLLCSQAAKRAGRQEVDRWAGGGQEMGMQSKPSGGV